MKIKTEKCIICSGTGKVYGTKPNSTVPEKCSKCEGSGVIQSVIFEPSKPNNN